jgi:glucosamine--fructose-6-phosphate aminotransferase (isomerizing)
VGERRAVLQELGRIPEKIEHILGRREEIQSIAEKYQEYENFLFIGRKWNMPLALEGALKLKEVTYVHAEGYGAGEMKHGPLAMIDERFPTIVLAPHDDIYEKTLSNIEEIRARKGPVIAIATEGDTQIHRSVSDVFDVPATHQVLSPLLNAVPLQLFAYYMGVLRNRNVDKPRNLAKSVTVE